ncbi:MAG: hypothetical protein IJH39_00055 [Clostridia bacterium]|nr:hypothetical protein [Clostridia bacterium]
MKIYYVKFVLHCALAVALQIFFYIVMRKLASIELIPLNSVMPAHTIFSIVCCMTCISDNLKALKEVTDNKEKKSKTK